MTSRLRLRHPFPPPLRGRVRERGATRRAGCCLATLFHRESDSIEHLLLGHPSPPPSPATGEGANCALGLMGALSTGVQNGVFYDRSRRTNKTGHPNRAARRRRRADRGVVLSHRGGADAVRAGTRSRAADAARPCDPLARRAAGKPLDAGPAVHGRPRRWFARSVCGGPHPPVTGLRRESAGALAPPP